MIALALAFPMQLERWRNGLICGLKLRGVQAHLVRAKQRSLGKI